MVEQHRLGISAQRNHRLANETFVHSLPFVRLYFGICHLKIGQFYAFQPHGDFSNLIINIIIITVLFYSNVTMFWTCLFQFLLLKAAGWRLSDSCRGGESILI